MVAFLMFTKGSEQVRTLIEVCCEDQDLVVTNAPLIASGGIHENYVLFTFCSLWDGFSKTAVFYKNVKEPYYVTLDSSNMCEIPHEVTDSKGTMYFGVFGVLGDITRTSKMVRYQVKQGAISSEYTPADPTPDMWEQLLSAYNDVLAKVEESNQDQQAFIGEANKAVIDCNIAANGCYEAIALLNYRASDLDGGDPTIDEIVEDENNVDGGTPY